jgi:DNA-binding transcriptional ArsR family regulator/ribosomal protein S19E (S16A)
VTSIASLARTATLVGEPARAAMMVALMDGRALTAGELAAAAGIGAASASAHLAQLREAGLLAGTSQGRHRYYRLASPAVAQMIESLMAVTAGLGPMRSVIRTGPRDPALRRARLCYDHLAGEIAVAIADRMRAEGRIELDDEGAALTGAGREFLEGLGVKLDEARGGRAFCRPCLDWSERRPHIAGAVGRAMLDRLLAIGWIARSDGSRALRITHSGSSGLSRHFGLKLDSSG